jgi:PAS domain S-box-containing protein
MAIPAVLIYLVRRRRDAPFPWIFWMFGLFIVTCGLTHLMAAITLSTPVYRLSGLVKGVTAAASWATVIGLVPLVPRALALRSPEALEQEVARRTAELGKVNAALQEQIAERCRVEAELDRRVQDRTAELTAANAALQAKVAEHEHAEKALRDSEQRFRLLVDGVQDYAIFLLDPQGRVSSWNNGAKRLTGYHAAEIHGRHFSCFYPKDKARDDYPDYELEVAAEKGRFEDEGWRLRKDGSRFWANTVLSALHDAEGRLQGFSKITRDISERRQAEQRLRDVVAELERSNRELEQFASVASHDLQEPLRKIQVFGERLQERLGGKIDETAQDYLKRMERAAQRMSMLITDLLTFARVTTEGRPFVPVPLGLLAREVLSDLEVSVQQSGGRVEIDTLPTMAADPVQMRQLLQNLIANALKFHRPGVPPVVHVRATILNKAGQPADGGAGALCRLTVEDNGIGFDEKYRERIFGLFQRLHGRAEYEGTGMGLAIVRKIVQRHGGTVRAEGRPGAGAVFTVTMPICHEEEGEHEAHGTATHDPHGR